MTTTHAELILFNGTIHTLETAASVVEAVAIASGRILVTGSPELVEATAHANTRRIDLRGRTLIPGFYDARVTAAADSRAEQVMNAALKLGVTSLGWDQLTPDQLEACRKLAAERHLPLRLNAIAQRFTADGNKLPLPERFESNWLRIDTVRLQTADLDNEKLTARVWDVHRAGLRAALTASTTDEIERALAAIEYAARRLVSRLRHRLDVFLAPTDDQIERCRRLAIGVTLLPSTQPSLLARLTGLSVGMGSGETEAANPLAGLQSVASRAGTAPALSAYTLGGALVAGEERLKGSLAPNKYADFVILSGDPIRAPVERIAALWIEMVFSNGQLVYTA